MNNPNIPFLMYHNINSEGDIYALSKDNFREQVKFLSNKDYNAISLDNFIELHKVKKTIFPKTVLLTFDDGFEDNHSKVLPILMEYKLKANFFVTTNYIGKKEFLTKKQIKEISDSGSCIGSHSKNHIFLNNLKEKVIFSELADSKKVLEDIIGKKINHLSLPGGRYNNLVINIAKSIGYKTICNSEVKINNLNSNLYYLGRIPIKKHTNLLTFKKIIEGDNLLISSLGVRYKFKKILKSILGNRLYDLFWKLKNS